MNIEKLLGRPGPGGNDDDAQERRLSEYLRGPADLKRRLEAVPEGLWRFKPAPEKWSVHEIVIHLADAEAQSYLRCRTILAEPGNPIANCDENRWAAELEYHRQEWKDALDLIFLIRKLNYHLLRRTKEVKWSNHAMHSVRGRMDLRDWLATYVDHIPRHVEQIERNESLWKKAAHA
jgi:hypothetical protein